MGRCGLRGAVALALVATLGVHLIGCSTGEQAPVQPSTALQNPAPTPVSPPQALRLLKWIYDNRSIEPYREILSDDFRFYCSPADSAGNPWRGTAWTREDELAFATALFVGGGSYPPATSIQLTLDRNFFVFPDPGYPWDPTGRWHKSIRTTLSLMITAGGENLATEGHAVFYFVRGDSALIPEELRMRGFGPDSTRWYIRRWDDETSPEGSTTFAAQPASARTLCSIKALYR